MPEPPMSQSKDTPSTRASRLATPDPGSGRAPDSIMAVYPSEVPTSRSSSLALIPPRSRAALRRLPIPKSPNVPRSVMLTTIVAMTTKVVKRKTHLAIGDDDNRRRMRDVWIVTEPDWSTTSKRIRYMLARLKLDGISGREVAKRVGVSKGYINMLPDKFDENPGTEVGFMIFLRLCAVGGVGTLWLATGKGRPTDNPVRESDLPPLPPESAQGESSIRMKKGARKKKHA